jgi:trans-aconitate methyltransferase
VSDDARIAAYYDRLVDAYGSDPQAVDASSERSLLLRYEALAAVTDLTGRSILEVGCGLGGLGVFLLERFADLRYRGIDVSPRMIETAAASHPELDVAVASALDLPEHETCDVVLAQGIFYLLGEHAEAKLERLVTKMFALASEAVAFTAISSWSPRQEPTEFYAEPLRTLSFCRTLTPRVVLRHDYHPGDMALYLYKKGFD